MCKKIILIFNGFIFFSLYFGKFLIVNIIKKYLSIINNIVFFLVAYISIDGIKIFFYKI